MTDIQINKKIIAKSIIISGGPISVYEWKLDSTIQTNNTNTFTIQPNTLIIGNHTINLRCQNYCGNWTSIITKDINIIKEINMAYTQTDVINVDSQNMNKIIKIIKKSTITLNIVDEADLPIKSAQVSIDEISSASNELGIATLKDVPYGNHNIVTTIT